MSVFGCAQVRELAPELALGVLGGAERAEAIMHVNDCARCQALVLELTEAVDALPLLAPEAEPPPGFEQRVLASIDAGRRRTLRRWITSVAVAAAAAAILSITVVRVVDAGDSGSGSTAAAGGSAPVAATMRGAGSSSPAGWVYVTGHHAVAVALDYGVAPGVYQLKLVNGHGAHTVLGMLTVADARGSWTGSTSVTIGAGSTISLVDGAGNTVCSARLPDATGAGAYPA